MTTFHVRSWGRSLDVPPGVLDNPRVEALVRDLERIHPAEPGAARRFVHEILAATYANIGESFAAATRTLFADVLRLRRELRVKYEALRVHFEAQRGKPVSELPPELQPKAFQDLFDELIAKIDELSRETVETHVRKMPPSQLADDIEVSLESAWAEIEGEPMPEPGSRGRREAPERRGTGIVESERLERIYYNEALKGKDPEAVEAILEQAKSAFFSSPNSRWRLPDGWEVRLVKSPEYGARVAQQAAFADVDPLFAAHGFELEFETDGFTFRPDAVQLYPDGSIKFYEYKDPLRVGSVETYRSNLDRQAELLDTMLDRAEAARLLPRCHGWTYDTSVAEMNAFLFELLDSSLPENSPLRRFVDVVHPAGRTL